MALSTANAISVPAMTTSTPVAVHAAGGAIPNGQRGPGAADSTWDRTKSIATPVSPSPANPSVRRAT